MCLSFWTCHLVETFSFGILLGARYFGYFSFSWNVDYLYSISMPRVLNLKITLSQVHKYRITIEAIYMYMYGDSQSHIIFHTVINILLFSVAVVVAFFCCWAPFNAQRLITSYVSEWTPLLFEIQSTLFYISGIHFY